MFQTYANFIRGVSLHWVGKTGVILTTSSFATFLVLEALRLLGSLTNAYMGLVTYLLFPSLFIVGLILIPIGWFLHTRRAGKTTREILSERFDEGQMQGGFFGSGLLKTVVLFTFANVVFMSVASVRTLKFMDDASFCGTACHEVMNPEWVAYQSSPHARVKCVECHVGEGVDALLSSKLNGAWQMVSATFDLYERPIPTPVHQLRPAPETCEKCHWPERFYGKRLKTIYSYKSDETSTPRYTTLSLKVDAGLHGLKGGIHWHVSRENVVRYASLGDLRQDMIWVEVRQEDGTFKRYTNKRIEARDDAPTATRKLDCVDCHNRATHIYEDPEVAVDARIQLGDLDRSLPFLKREALRAITVGYSSREQADDGISDHMHGFYQRNYPTLAGQRLDAIERAVEVLQEVYARNVFHQMKITWGAYPSHIGHKGGTGCFRCHSPSMVAADGTSISYRCTMCHSILADSDDTPFKMLETADASERDTLRDQFLRQEFLTDYR